MSTVDRMFRVIVAGGVALTAALPGAVAGCGGSVATVSGPADAGADRDHPGDAFPTEGPAEPDAFPSETAQQLDAFPTEGPAMIDSGHIVDSGSEADVFPQEGPAQIDSGFPSETASP